MTKALKCAVYFMVLALFLAPWANAEKLSPEYFYGRWAIDSENCSSPDSEYIEFRKNGTFESTRTGKTEILGFWELKNDVLELQMLTSPAFYQDILRGMTEFRGQFQHFQGRMLIFNTQQNNFETFGLIGSELDRAKTVRCQ
jgi:hypothetical protein